MNLQAWIKSLKDRERSFHQAIMADLWDQTNWLVYADWLEENSGSDAQMLEDATWLRHYLNRLEGSLTRGIDEAYRLVNEYGREIHSFRSNVLSAMTGGSWPNRFHRLLMLQAHFILLSAVRDLRR